MIHVTNTKIARKCRYFRAILIINIFLLSANIQFKKHFCCQTEKHFCCQIEKHFCCLIKMNFCFLMIIDALQAFMHCVHSSAFFIPEFRSSRIPQLTTPEARKELLRHQSQDLHPLGQPALFRFSVLSLQQ